MNVQMQPLVETITLNTGLFLNCLDGVNDETARRRVSDTANNMAFVALHLIDARCYLARSMGGDARHPFEDLVKDANRIDDLSRFPKVEELCSAWKEASLSLRQSLEALTDEDLAEEIDQPFPVSEKTKRGMVTFLIHHDSYHLGQLALLRKQLGLPAMSYR